MENWAPGEASSIGDLKSTNLVLPLGTSAGRCSTRECRCTPAIISRYLGKISGPLLDRIDLHVEVPAVPYKEMRAGEQGVSSAEMRTRIERARQIQHQRGHSNAHLSTKLLRRLCRLDDSGERTLEMAMRRRAISARAHSPLSKSPAPSPTSTNPKPSPPSTWPKRCSTAAWTGVTGANRSRWPPL